jgi:hypothetical protein
VTFIELVREVIRETGLAGGDPADLETVLDQTGDLADAVAWTRNGCLEVDNLWKTWKYLWREHSIAFAAAQSNIPPQPTDYTVRQWDRASFWLNKTSTSPTKLAFEDWRVFRARTGTPLSGKSSIITVRPDNTLRTDRIPAASYTFSAECWKRPTILTLDDDEPDMPSDYHRIIVCRAKMEYGDLRDAPEVLEGAGSEYQDYLDKLQSDQLESHEFDRMSEQDVDLEMAVPGY